MDSKTVERVKSRWANLISIFKKQNNGNLPTQRDIDRLPRLKSALEQMKNLPTSHLTEICDDRKETNVRATGATILLTPKKPKEKIIFETPCSSEKTANRIMTPSKLAFGMETPEYNLKSLPRPRFVEEIRQEEKERLITPLKNFKNKNKHRIFPQNNLENQISSEEKLDQSINFGNSPVKYMFSDNKFGKAKKRKVFFSPESTQRIIKLRTNIEIQQLNFSKEEKVVESSSFLRSSLFNMEKAKDEDEEMTERHEKRKADEVEEISETFRRKKRRTAKDEPMQPSSNFVRLNLRKKNWRKRRKGVRKARISIIFFQEDRTALGQQQRRQNLQVFL
eukprot:snap_masked-scaffold_43-processed-gene-1.46-mRNA-1 protein AED:1.00 eAED:1.00 QI:0/0/0/0/1/1/2/0/335